MSEYIIQCPWCFHDFPQEYTVFRANVGFDTDKLKNAEDPAMHLFRKFDSENSRRSDRKLDQKRIDFWKNLGGTSAYTFVDSTWDHPHLDPKSPDFSGMISTEPLHNRIPDADGFFRDDDGFIFDVRHKFSHAYRPTIRLCPHCHNPLPDSYYGKYPVRFIGIVGATGCGKTVFRRQLSAFEEHLAAECDFFCPPRYRHSDPLSPYFPLPKASGGLTVHQPLAIPLLDKEILYTTSDNCITLVFYDIPQESLSHPAAAARIARCDGLLLLLDPEQIPVFSGSPDTDPAVQNLIHTLCRIRAEGTPNSPNWDEIPVAVCLTKSDTLKNSPHFPAEPPIFRQPKRDTRGLDREETLEISNCLKSLLQDHAGDLFSSLSAFRLKECFAFSALPCGIYYRYELNRNLYIMDKKNARLLQTLESWIWGWNERSDRERQTYPPCPVRRNDGSEIRLPVDEQIPGPGSESIRTEIQAEEIHCGQTYLSLQDVMCMRNDGWYPAGESDPLRILEPVKWILWQMLLIEPKFIPVPLGSKPFWMRKTKWEAYEQMLRQMNEEAFKRWYNRM